MLVDDLDILLQSVQTDLWNAALVVAGEVPGIGAGLHGRLNRGVADTSLPVRLQLLPVRTTAARYDPGR